MNWLKAVGYGILVWAAMFVIACVLIAFKVTNADLMGVIMIIASIIVLWLISKQYKIANMMDGLLVGIVWLIVSEIGRAHV